MNENSNQFITMTIGIVVAVIVASVVLIPIVNGMTEPTKIHTNEGIRYVLADEDDTDTHTLLISLVDGDYVLTLDDEVIDDTYFGDNTFTILFSEHGILRYVPTTGVLYFGGTQSEGTAAIWKTLDAPTDGNPTTITIVGDSATVTGLVATVATTYNLDNDLAYVSNDGDYVYGYNPCVVADSFICGGGVTYSPFESATVICFNGNVGEIDAGIYRASPPATLDDYTINTTNVGGNLLRIDSIVFDCTQSDTSKTATYTYFLAPAEVVYDNPNYVGGMAATILQTIPIFIVLAILMGVAGMFLNRRENF